MFADKCEYCKKPMSGGYSFKDSEGKWHEAHKSCCNPLSRMIEGGLSSQIRGEKHS
jgi:hypothetical protein